MATSITVTKKVPAGTATKVFETGSTESASMTFSVFGQQTTAYVDIKILPSAYTIPQDRFDATNFTKTEHPGGPISLGVNYITGEVVGGTTYNYLPQWLTYRVRNATTNLFDAPKSFFPGAYNKFSDNSGYAIEDPYSSSTLKIRSFTAGGYAAGTYNKFSDISAQPQVGSTKTNFVNIGCGFASPATTTDSIGTMASDGTVSYINNINTTSVASSNSGIKNAHISRAASQYGSSYVPSVFRMTRAYSSSVWTISAVPSYGTVMVSYSNGTFTSASWSSSWQGSVTPGLGTWDATSTYKLPNIFQFGTDPWGQSAKAFALFNSSSYTETGFGVNSAIRNQVLVWWYTMGWVGYGDSAPTQLYHPTPATYGYLVDATFIPMRVGTTMIFKCGAATGQTRYFSITENSSSPSPVDYGASPPAGVTAAYITTPYNAKTLAVNYANYNQYKFTNGMADSDGLAYYTDGTGSYNTNGQSFWTKEGKYTLIRDEALTKLDTVSTDEYWFDRQFSASKGVRVEYTGITLAPSQSFWITSPVDIQILAFGFKE